MTLDIDASNIRTGGGLTHITALLSNAQPSRHSFNKVVVWANKATLDKLPDRKWLIKSNPRLLNRSYAHRDWWQKLVLPKLAKKFCDILFLPVATNPNFHPNVSFCQNQLPFDSIEKKNLDFHLPGYAWKF